MLYWAFVAGYTCFQLLGGLYGQRLGARRAFTVIGLIAFLSVILTPTAPSFLSGSALFAVLMTAQLLLGIAQAPVFPVSGRGARKLVSRGPLVARAGAAGNVHELGCRVDSADDRAFDAIFRVARRHSVDQLAGAVRCCACRAWYGRSTPREHAGVSAAEPRRVGRCRAGRGGPDRLAKSSRQVAPQPQRASGDVLLHVHELCFLSSVGLVFSVPGPAAALHGAARRMAGGFAAARRRSRRRTGRQHRCVAVHPLRTALGIPAGASRSGCPSPDCC